MSDTYWWQIEHIETYEDILCTSDCMSCAGDGICVGNCMNCDAVINKETKGVRLVNYMGFCSELCMKMYIPEWNEYPLNLAEYIAILRVCPKDGCKTIVENGEYCDTHWREYESTLEFDQDNNIPY